jgi:hypothetical protein
MKLVSTTARRVVTVAAAAAAGLAISTAAYAASSSPGRPADSAPQCTASDLGVWVAIDQGNGAAGTIYYPLEFTNLSGRPCYLLGYPGVSALDADGHQLGSPADWEGSGARLVTLAPGATAHTLLGYHDVAVTTEPGCDQVNSMAELRVYPPGQRSSTDAAFSVPACSHRGPVYLSIIEPIIPGVGTING